MIQTQKFSVPSIFMEQNRASAQKSKLVALDIGYSGVKCFTDNLYACFPSLARRIDVDNIIGEPRPDDILYKDNNGKVWTVGAGALRSMTLSDTNESEFTLYSRHRYDSEMFKVIYRVGMGLCLTGECDTPCRGDRPAFLQTGLPPAYMKSDESDIINALAGSHLFYIKRGNEKWREINFDLPEKNISVMPQPMGSLYSVSFNEDGNMIPGAKGYFKSGILGFDSGFGTADTFIIQNGELKSYESFDDLGMKIVYKRLSEQIHKSYGIHIPLQAIQKTLIDGHIKILDKKNMKTEIKGISDLLYRCSHEVCNEAIERLKTSYNYLQDVRYLLLTGGTGEAWRDSILKHFADMQRLHIIMGNVNSPALPQIFSNVRGYYYYRLNHLNKSS